MINTNYKPLILHIQQMCDANNVRLYTDCDKTMLEREKPCVLVKITGARTLEDQVGMDLRNECRGEVRFNLIIETENVDDMIRLEESVSKPLNNSVISYLRADGAALEATISSIPDQASERKAVDVEGKTEKHYQSTHHFQCTGMVFPKIIEHPVQIELERQKQLNALLRLSLIEGVYTDLKQQINKLFSLDAKENFADTEERFVALLQDDNLREQYIQIRRSLNDLRQQCADMYVFENLCKEKITMEDEGFRFCYMQMITQSVDLITATEKYKAQKQGEKEADKAVYERAIKQRINKLVNSDTMVLHVAEDHQRLLEELYIDESDCTWATVDTSYEFNSERYAYRAIDEKEVIEKKLDYATMMPITLLASVTVYSINKEQLEQSVQNIKNVFTQQSALAIELSVINNESLYVEGELIGSIEDVLYEEIGESKGYYWTTFNVVYNQCLWNAENPKNMLSDKQHLERILALISIRKQIETECECLQKQDDSTEAKKNADELHNEIRKIDRIVYGELAEKIHIPKEHRREAYYQTYYKMLCEGGCDIKTSSEIISKQIEERIARRNLARKEALLQGNGDEMLNRITDVIVQDLKTRLDNAMPVYGGTTYAEWFLAGDCKKNLAFPNVLLKVSVDFDSERKEYCNVNKVGDSIKHQYSHEALPLMHSVFCRIYAKERTEAEVIQKQIYDYYFDKGIQFAIPDPVSSDEHAIYEMMPENELGSIIQSKSENGETIWRSIVSFKEQPNVYSTNSIKQDKTKATKDPVLQLSYIEQAEYCCSHVERLDEAIKCLDTYYKTLFDYGFLSNLFCTEDYKKLKNSIKEGQAVDIKLFNKVFEQITNYYPLFSKFAYGWTYEQIRKDILGIQMQYKELVDELAELAGIPKKITVSYKVDDEISKDFEKINTDLDETMARLGFEPVGDAHAVNTTTINPRKKEALTTYRRAMYSDIYCTIDDAINKYRKKQGDRLEVEERQRRQWEAEQQALAEMRAQEAEYEYYSSGGSGRSSGDSGFLSSMLSTAAGVTIGNKVSNRKKEKKSYFSSGPKKDLFGSAICQRGKGKNYCLACPAYHRCTQQWY